MVGLLSLYQQHIDHMVQLTGTEYAYNTVRRYKSSLNSLKRFMNFNDIGLSKLGFEFVRDYYTYLLTIEGLQPNSAFKNIKGLYRVINIALEKKLLTANPFKDFHSRYKQPIRPYLTEVEVNSLLNHKFTTPRHNAVRDLFLFQVYTGLAYIDIIKLTAKNIEVGLDGKQWIITVRHKTGTRLAIPLLPIALAIITKYDYVLPYYSNQHFNRYLKELAEICNINKKITTHVGRHTFATTVCLSQGVPIETVSKMLGHTNISTTQIYAKITDRKIAKDMAVLM